METGRSIYDKETQAGPYQLVLKGINYITFQKCLVGEVWICSGQSKYGIADRGLGKNK
jgi:hypothetical protein